MGLAEISSTGAIKETLAVGNGLFPLYDSGSIAAAASIDTGAGGFSTAYNHLKVLLIARSATAALTDLTLLNFNNDSGANYSWSTWNAGGGSDVATFVEIGTCFGATATANYPWYASLEIPFYSGTTFYKGVRTISQGASLVSTMQAGPTNDYFGSWHSTAAINRIKITLNTGANLIAGSRLIVYGWN